MALAANGLHHSAVEEAERAFQLPRAAMCLLPQVLRVFELVLSLRSEISCKKLCKFLLRVVEKVDGEGFVDLNLLRDGGLVVQADQQRGWRFGGNG